MIKENTVYAIQGGADLFVLYDTVTNRYYTRGGWTSEGKKPRVFRLRGPMKLALLYIADLYTDIPRSYIMERRIKDANPDLHWRTVRALANKERIAMLPDSYEIHRFTGNGLVLVERANQWY